MNMIKKVVSKRAPVLFKESLRPPVTVPHLHALAEHLNLLSSFNITVFAAACMRLGEILVDSAVSSTREISLQGDDPGCQGVARRLRTKVRRW